MQSKIVLLDLGLIFITAALKNLLLYLFLILALIFCFYAHLEFTYIDSSKGYLYFY